MALRLIEWLGLYARPSANLDVVAPRLPGQKGAAHQPYRERSCLHWSIVSAFQNAPWTL